MRSFDELKRFWEIQDRLRKNEVYVLLLIGKKDGHRQILDTVLVKSNNFDEFFNKTSILINKARRFPFETELLFDVNKKDAVEGLENGWIDIRSRIVRNEDVRNFFSILLRNIRYAQVTDYVLIKDREFMQELEPRYVIEAGGVYYHILNRGDEDCIKKPEVPIPGTIMNGMPVRLHYVNE